MSHVIQRRHSRTARILVNFDTTLPLISQSVLWNDTGVTFTFSINAGELRITASANVFVVSRSSVNGHCLAGSNSVFWINLGTGEIYRSTMTISSPTIVDFNTMDMSGSPMDSGIADVMFDIEIW